GEMAYMERTRHQRLDPSQLLPGARSVIAVAMLYAPAERAAATQGKIARYAGGRDYHDVIRPRLNTLARFIEGAAGGEARSRAAERRPGIGDWLFGGDVCQEVCPWNRKAPSAREPALSPDEPLAAATLLGLDEDAFRARFRGSALRRAKRSGLRRNAAIVLGNL